MAAKSYEEKYTKPELRRKLKERIRASDKGGRPGQWSARKSQLLVQAYEKHGGGYRGAENREARKSLEDWQSGEWQTSGGSAEADRGATMKRYLPAEAWARLSPAERAQAERAKRRAEKEGRQRAKWPPAVRRVMRQLGRESASKAELYERAKELGVEGRSQMSRAELERAIARVEDRDGATTKSALYERARELDIEGRSRMSKAELARAVREAS
jgi:hypothetical protein